MKKILRIIFLLTTTGGIILFLLFFYNTKIIESNDSVLNAPSTTKFIDIGNEKIAYSEINNQASTTVVFVGGLSAWNGTWERTIRELNNKKNSFNYIAVDLPPFGYSIPSPDKNYFRDTQAERIEKFIKNKKINHVILIAHSYGAGPGTEYALRNQEKIKKLILIDGVLNVDEVKTINNRSLVQANFLRNLLIGVLVHNDTFTLSRLKTFVYITDHVDNALLDIYTRSFDTKNTTERLSGWFRDYTNDPLTYKSNFSTNYKNFSVPVRLIWGDKDTITPIDGTKILLDTVSDIRLITLNGVGHIPMIENHTLFDAALLDALNK